MAIVGLFNKNDIITMASGNKYSEKEEGKQTTVFNFSARHRFVGCILAVVILALGSFCFLVYNYRQAQKDIVELQRKDVKMLEDILYSQPCNQKRGTCDIEKIAELLDRHQNRVESLLETEYNKLQADFNILMLWASSLMIVFLVFSLYSIFKTDEMLGKAENEANRIHQLLAESNQACENITNQAQIVMSQMQHLPTVPMQPQPPFKAANDTPTEVVQTEGEDSHDK